MRADGIRNPMVRYFNRDRNSPPFVVMMDSTNLKCIHMATDLTFDGTFQYAPNNMPNSQIYTMHATYHQLPNFNNNFLVGIAFVQNKDIPTYEQIFNVIKEQLIAEFGDIGCHKTIHMDHEIAAITAARRVFPDWTMHSCYFHFGKNLRTKMGQVLLDTEEVGKWFSALCGNYQMN
uniref:MULE transposase domain-containing protein n=1 Tax=Panagrolaimus superbus TaxID=310955 RepID=A0A914YEZ0_9BILA